MKRPITYALITAAIVGSGASLAFAQGSANGGHGHGERALHRLDLNGDGAISPVEAGAVQAVRFLRLDADGDGTVTQEEMFARMQKRIAERVAKRFAMMDRNGDGRVERAEFDENGAERFARLDSDGDGRVSGEEIRTRRHGWGWGKHDDKLPVE